MKESIDETCGKNRTLIVTVFNLKQPTMIPSARHLADNTVTNIGISFALTLQPGAGLFSYGLSVLVVI